MTDLSSKRRCFQPPITTFFTTTSDSNTSRSHLSYNHYSAVTHSPTPVVPAKIQASLLSVGMRVRKSVAEGYKTHHAKMEEKHTVFAIADDKSDIHKSTYSAPPTRSELAPFCGITKSNDYNSTTATVGVQPLPRHDYDYSQHNIITTDEPDDAFSLPPSSQESLDSEISETRPTVSLTSLKKRSHHDYDFDYYEDGHEYEFEAEGLDNHAWQDPLRLHPIHPAMERTILSPTLNEQRWRFSAAQRQSHKKNTMDLDDFEEPLFLRRREEVDMDYEVQMGGYRST